MSTSNKIMTLYDTAELMKIDEMETDNMIPLLTIGYEGYSIEDFVNQLKAYNALSLAMALLKILFFG